MGCPIPIAFKAFVKMLKKEAVYVQDAAGTDPTVITTAGFQVMTGPAPAPPLTKPVIQKVVQKGTGQQQVFVDHQAGTRMLEIRRHFRNGNRRWRRAA